MEGVSPKHWRVDLDGLCVFEEGRAAPEWVDKGWPGLGFCPFNVQDSLVGL